MATPTTLPASFTAGQVLTAAQQNGLRGAFRVLQVVSTTKSDTFTSSSTSFADITGLSVSITPQEATSKVLVLVQLNASNDVGVNYAQVQLVRGSTAIDIGDTAGSRTRASGFVWAFDQTLVDVVTLSFLDSPATTSATTYKVQLRNTAAGTSYVNRSKLDSDTAVFARLASTITVMEISA
jgi:hypothetical protein